MERIVTSLFEEPKNSGKYYIRFSYYERDEWGRLQFTGDSEDCYFTEDELYDFVKPKLVKRHTKVRRFL